MIDTDATDMGETVAALREKLLDHVVVDAEDPAIENFTVTIDALIKAVKHDVLSGMGSKAS